MNHPFLFRELHGEQELELFLRKRYEAYFNSPQRPLLEKEDGIDIDIYDLQSRHYGVFSGKEPVGYIRIILDKDYWYCENAFNIGLRHHRFQKTQHGRENFSHSPHPSFYFDALYPNQTRPLNGHASYFQDPSQLVEPSRIVLFEEYKSLGLARFITECALVLYYELCVNHRKHAVITCAQSHSRFYRAYGFESLFNDLVNPIVPGKNEALLILKWANHIKTSAIPSKVQPRILNMIERWEKSGNIEIVL